MKRKQFDIQYNKATLLYKKHKHSESNKILQSLIERVETEYGTILCQELITKNKECTRDDKVVAYKQTLLLDGK